jgi:uncharacterized protein YllA (UPF0747 family)
VRLSNGVCSFQEAARIIRARPADFSPNAALRPILQDAVLPVAATVAGPTELLYLWQIRPIYAVAKVTPSLLMPRISATFVEAKIWKAAEKAGLGRDRLFEVVQEDSVPEEPPPDADVDRIEECVDALLKAIDRLINVGSEKWLRKSRESLEVHVARIVRRLRETRQAESALNAQRRSKIAAALAPGGKAQERTMNIIEFLNRYGSDFIRRCLDQLDPLALGHQMIFVLTEKKRKEA